MHANLYRVAGPGATAAAAGVINHPHQGPQYTQPKENLAVIRTQPRPRHLTSHQYRDLLQNSGFRVNRVIATASPFSIIEAAPTRAHAQPRHTVNT